MNDVALPTPSRPIVHLSTQSARRGGERQIVYLHQGLQQRGWPSHLLCRAPSVFDDTTASTAVSWHGTLDPFGFVSFWQDCRRLRPALLHCHDANAFTIGSLLGSLLRVPVINTRRVLAPIRTHVLNRWKYRRAAALVAISSAVEESLRQVAPRTPTFCVPSGVTGEPPTDDMRFEARRSLAIDDRTVLIGCVGHFTPEKQPELLLDLATHLAQVRRNVVVMIVGPLDPALERAARHMSNVIATGAVRNALDYYPAFDLYVSTSTSEGLGSALLDAVVRNIPSFAVDSGGARDIFGSLPRLSGPGDRYDFFRLVERALDERPTVIEESRTLGARARQRFSVDAMVEGNLRVYATLLGHENAVSRRGHKG
jgi:glycosyltransferase involved in cell wall biosynthesis